MTDHPSADAWKIPQTTEPWAQRPDESPVAYSSFLAYRDLGPSRSLVRVGQEQGKNVSLLEDWSSRHQWVARATAWDRHTQHARDEAAIASRRDMVDRHRQVAAGVLAAAVRLITPPPSVKGEKRATWKPSANQVRAASQALREALAAERLSQGLPTVITRTQAELTETVQQAIAAQRLITGIVREGLCDDDECQCCQRVRLRLKQAQDMHQRITDTLASP